MSPANKKRIFMGNGQRYCRFDLSLAWILNPESWKKKPCRPPEKKSPQEQKRNHQFGESYASCRRPFYTIEQLLALNTPCCSCTDPSKSVKPPMIFSASTTDSFYQAFKKSGQFFPPNKCSPRADAKKQSNKWKSNKSPTFFAQKIGKKPNFLILLMPSSVHHWLWPQN